MTDAQLLKLLRTISPKGRQVLAQILEHLRSEDPRCGCTHSIAKHGRKGCSSCPCDRKASICEYCSRSTFMHAYIAEKEGSLPRRRYPPCCSREECAAKWTARPIKKRRKTPNGK